MDAGCGDGRLVYEARRADIGMDGVDISERALRLAEAFTPEAAFRRASITSLPYEDGEYECVVCSEVLEHLGGDEVEGALGEMRRVLHAGGTIIVTVPSHRLKVTAKHEKHYGPDELAGVLGKYFEGVWIEGLGRRSLLSGAWYNMLSMAVLALYPLRRTLPKLAGWVADRHWNFYGRHLAPAGPREAGYLLAVGRRSS